MSYLWRFLAWIGGRSEGIGSSKDGKSNAQLGNEIPRSKSRIAAKDEERGECGSSVEMLEFFYFCLTGIYRSGTCRKFWWVRIFFPRTYDRKKDETSDGCQKFRRLVRTSNEGESCWPRGFGRKNHATSDPWSEVPTVCWKFRQVWNSFEKIDFEIWMI